LREKELVNKCRTMVMGLLFYSSELIFLNQSIILRACVDEVDNLMFMLPASEAKGSKHCLNFVRVVEQILCFSFLMFVGGREKTSKRLGKDCVRLSSL